MIQTHGENEMSPLIDLGLIDFDKLRQLYGERKHTAADRLANLLRRRSSSSATRNSIRVEFVRRIEDLIAEYNAGNLNIDEYLRRLIRLTQELNEDEQRVASESMTASNGLPYTMRPGWLPEKTTELNI